MKVLKGLSYTVEGRKKSTRRGFEASLLIVFMIYYFLILVIRKSTIQFGITYYKRSQREKQYNMFVDNIEKQMRKPQPC